MSDENIEFVVALRGGSEAASEVGKVTMAVHEAGGATRALGADSRAASGGASAFGGGLKRMAAGLLAVGAGYKVYNAAKGAISYTKELAEQSNALTKATGLTIEESSRYLGVAGALGVTSQQLNTSFKSLATQTELQANKHHVATDSSTKHRLAVINETLAVGALEKRLAKGTITQAEYRLEQEKIKLNADKAPTSINVSKTAFDKLGISQEWVTKHGKDFNEVILEVTKRLNEMKGSPEKVKIETELFGRSWATLNPLLGEGSEHLENVLGLAKKFGVELHGGMNQQLKELTEAQLESSLASDGLRIAFTKTAAGPMINLLKGFARIKNFAREKNWTGFSKELGKVFDVAEHVIEQFELRSIEGFGQIAPKMLNALWNGFKRASLPNKALMAGLIASKMGLTGAAFGGIGKLVMKSLSKSMIAEVPEMAAAGTVLGGAFEVALTAAAVVGVVALGVYVGKKLGEALAPATKQYYVNGKEATKGQAKHFLGDEESKRLGLLHAAHQNNPKLAHSEAAFLRKEKAMGRHPKAAFGAQVRRGGMVEVGERGRELVDLPPSATVTPLPAGSLADDRKYYLVVDGKVLARVLRRQNILSQAAGA